MVMASCVISVLHASTIASGCFATLTLSGPWPALVLFHLEEASSEMRLSQEKTHTGIGLWACNAVTYVTRWLM